jgi:sec-independent protein translocase protein TatB
VFDLSLPKLLILAVIALVVFGPNELPAIAAQAGRALRDLRTIAEAAKNDLREGLGPEFADFEIDDLNPKRFVHKHLLDDPDADQAAPAAARAPRRSQRHASRPGRAPAVRTCFSEFIITNRTGSPDHGGTR